MNDSGYLHLLLAWTFVLLPSSAKADEQFTSRTAMQIVLSDVKEAIRDKEKYTRWQAALQALSGTELESLLQHDSDTVALGAAWQIYVVRKTRSNTNNEPTISKEGSVAFSAFIEGRFRIRLPHWYHLSLEGGVFRGNFVSFFEYNAYEKHATKIHPRLFVLPGEDAIISDDKIRLKGSTNDLLFPVNDFLDSVDFSPIGVSFASTGDRFWLARYPEAMGEYSLAFFSDGICRWTVPVWGELTGYGRSGDGWHHAVKVLRHGKTVYVVGVGDSGTYLEGFDAASGSIRIRFVSSTRDRLSIRAIESPRP